MGDVDPPDFVQQIMDDVLLHPVAYSLLFLYLTVEIVFYLYIILYLDPSIQEPIGQEHTPIQKTLYTQSTRESLHEALLMLHKVKDRYSFESWCYLFFLRSNLEDVHTENMDSAFAWAIYAEELHELSEVEKNAVVSLRKEALELFRTSLKEGFNPDVRHVRFNMEPVTYIHKPLITYAALTIVDFYAHIHLAGLGFKRYWLPDRTSYWYRPSGVSGENAGERDSPESSHLLNDEITDYRTESKNDLNNKVPILILHGICPGWGYYLKLISVFSDRAMILYENDAIKWNWITLEVPEPSTVCENVEMILETHAIRKVSIVAHSWGTFLAAWIVKSKPNLVSHLALIEPIAVNVELFDTTYYVLYQQGCSVQELCINVFIRNDITVSNNLRRHFAWYNCSLHLQDVPDHIGIFVSIAKDDRLVHAGAAEAFVKYEMKMRESGRQGHVGASTKTGKVAAISYIVWDGYCHGMTCDSFQAVDEIKRRIDFSEVDVISEHFDV